MIEILTKLITKDIEKVYDIEKVLDNGIIRFNEREIMIYKVEPANIIAWDRETKNRILNSYLMTIRGMPDEIQIVVSKEKSNLKNDIEQYKRKLLEVENYGLKMALKKYIEHLQSIENENGAYQINHYLIIEPKNGEINDSVKNAFNNLNEFGMSITRLTKKREVESVLKKAMK